MRYSKHSQNFLSNPKTIQKILQLTNLTTLDTVIDIGAGTGELTIPLASQVKQVIAIEKDPDLARKLAKKALAYPNIQIINTDFNQLDFTQ